jgi:hypothetical protein
VTDGTDGFVDASAPAASQTLPTPGPDHIAPNVAQNGYHTPDAQMHRMDLNQPAMYQHPVQSISPAPPPKVVDSLDLELIHQYCTRTYMSISSRLPTHAVWRDKVFNEGLRHGFLMEGILAVAALHKASAFKENSDEYRKYASAGLIHQNAALQEYSPLTAHPTADNATALFSLSMLLTLITFAVERLPNDMKTPGFSYLGSADSVPDINLPYGSSTRNFMMVISTLRGILLVIHQTQQYFEGDIAEFMRYPRTVDLPEHRPDVADMYAQLANATMSYHPEDVRTNMQTDDLQQLFRQQVIRLRDVTRCTSVIEWDSHIFSFLVSAPPEYIDLIKSGEPMALVILAHWAACFRCMDHHWWASGWGEKLVVDISNLIDMNAWSRLMEWPLSQVPRGAVDFVPSSSWMAG